MRWPPLWGAATHHFLPINYLSTRCSPVPCSLRSVHPSILALTLHSLVHAVQCWNMLQWSTDLPPFSPLLFSVKSNIFFHSSLSPFHLSLFQLWSTLSALCCSGQQHRWLAASSMEVFSLTDFHLSHHVLHPTTPSFYSLNLSVLPLPFLPQLENYNELWW